MGHDRWLKEAHPGVTPEEAVKIPAVKKMILDDIIATGKGAKLRGFELPKDIDFECTCNELGQVCMDGCVCGWEVGV